MTLQAIEACVSMVSQYKATKKYYYTRQNWKMLCDGLVDIHISEWPVCVVPGVVVLSEGEGGG
jgi:hypothetical protein